MNHAIEVWLTYKKLYIFQVHNSMGFGGKYTPMEKEMATHSSTLTSRIMEQFIASQRVGHSWSDLAAPALHEQEELCRFIPFTENVHKTL